MRRALLSALLCLFAAPALAAGNFEFDIPAPPGLELTIKGYAADGTQTFSATTSDMRERDGTSFYVTVVDEQIIFANRPARLCVTDPSGTWEALPEGKTEVCDEHPSEVRGTYTFVPTAETAVADTPAPLTTTLGCAADLLTSTGYLKPDAHVGADEAVRRAAARFSAVQARDPKLPRLEADTLRAWCERFAALPKSSMTPVPALLTSLNFGSDVSPGVARDTASGLLEAAAYIEAATGYRLGVAPAIFVSADPGWMTDAFVAETNLPANQWPERRAQFAACNGGEANYRMLFMCTSSRVFSEDWFGAGHKAQRAYALAHELFHVVQNELVGKQPDGCCDEQQFLGRLGPVWLIEGSAEYVAFRLLSDSGRMKLDREMKNQANNAKKASGRADDFELRSAYFSDPMAPSVGMVATQDLIGTVGLSSLTQFWAELGRGSAWPSAFRRAFGIAPNAFYAGGDKLLRTPGTASEFGRCVQGALAALGYKSGPIDGVIGKGTKARFADYLAGQKKLGKDWELTPQTSATFCLYLAHEHGLDEETESLADKLGTRFTAAFALDVPPESIDSVQLIDLGQKVLASTQMLTDAPGARDGRALKQARFPYPVAQDAVALCLTVKNGWTVIGSDGRSRPSDCRAIAPALGTLGLVVPFDVKQSG
jgi:hypothetical protein